MVFGALSNSFQLVPLQQVVGPVIYDSFAAINSINVFTRNAFENSGMGSKVQTYYWLELCFDVL